MAHKNIIFLSQIDKGGRVQLINYTGTSYFLINDRKEIKENHDHINANKLVGNFRKNYYLSFIHP